MENNEDSRLRTALSDMTREELIDEVERLLSLNTPLSRQNFSPSSRYKNASGGQYGIDMSPNMADSKMHLAEEIAKLSLWRYHTGTDNLIAPGILPQLPEIGGTDNYSCQLSDFLKYVHYQDREKLSNHLKKRLTPGSYTEYRIHIGDQVRFLHSRIIAYAEDCSFVEGYVQDMTYVVQGIHDLETVRYAVNNAQEEIFACYADGTLRFANKQFLDTHDIPGDISECKFYDIGTTCQSREEWDGIVKQIRDNGGSYKYTARGRNPGDEMTYYDLVTYMNSDHMGEELFWLFARDITLRESQESRIRELNSLMDAILNNIPVYLFVKDPSDGFRYRYWNKAFEEYSGIPACKALGNTDFDIFPDDKDAEKFRNDDLELLKNKERIEFLEEYESVTAGKRIVKTSKALVPTENEIPMIIGVSWDITDLKNAERELIDAKMKAEQSDKLKSAFLANMSHEIRTPLNAIVGFSKLIASAETDEEKQQFSDIIDTNAEMLLQLINDILDLSKIEAGTLEFAEKTLDLDELCRTLYEIHKSRVQPGVELVYMENDQGIKTTGDYNRISQVITNLITNAIKFTPRGEIRFGFTAGDGWINFFVKDTGTGINPEKIKMIFDRFVKLDNFVQGTGLGLSISRMIVEKMGGSINVESKPGEGSVFRFSIPYRPESRLPTAAPRKDAAGAPENTPHTGKTIMIAEDTDSNYMLVDAMLRKKYAHFRACNGVEAVNLFKQKRPDLILMDIKMPLMTGLEATRLIREISPEVPIIAVTAFAFDDDQQQAMDAGCDGFLTKPLSFKELDRTLDKYLK